MKTFNQYMLPLAIVIAGVIIAGTIYSSKGSSAKSPDKRSVADIISGGDSLKPKVDVQPITDADHTIGPKNAKVKLIIYTDPECPFCKMYHETITTLIQNHKAAGDLQVVYRMYPLESLHPKAPKESEAFECATEVGGADAFWKYADALFAITPSNNKLDPAKLYDLADKINLDKAKFKTCLDSGKYASQISNDVIAGEKAGGHGTPYSVVQVNGEFTPLVDNNGNGFGALPIRAIEQIVSEMGKM